MRYLKLVPLLIICLILMACGSKKGPTGGDPDLIKPKVLSTSPAELGDISSGLIEIDFDKPMDKSSITNAIYFYPPISERSISLSRQTLSIRIKEKLLPDTNYFVTLSTRLKDTRGNALDQAQSLVFRSGNPPLSKLSGLISYTDSQDKDKPINLSLFSADSLMVIMKEVTGSSYEINNLNPASYILRAYIDKNFNGRYDQTAEPFFESPFNIEEYGSLDLSMAYSDTSWAQIRAVKQQSRHELEVHLSEAIRSFSGMSLVQESDKQPVDILHYHIKGDRLFMLCTALDSTRYVLKINNLEDVNGTVSPASSLSFNAQGTPDETPPRLLSSTPRNGSTVNSLRPVIELEFSEIITAQNLSLRLIESDSNKEIPLMVTDIRGRSARLSPTRDLVNYRSHTVVVESTTKDYSGNPVESEIEILFLPVSRR
ncbi:MAG: Ig-like domain-containing protein [Candidatus Cloacimonetes bacterium]|nr:Ig-like domain-containing protein [Candidatus Cloacimonadota bacterium]